MISDLNRAILAVLNRAACLLPRKLRRFFSDFPGTLKLMEAFARNSTGEILTPEGQRLIINNLFHAGIIAPVSAGQYEPVIRKYILQLARPGMTAYDIGANVGVFSFLFASIVGGDGLVYAFEPEPINYKCLAASINLNNSRNIILDNRAISASAGQQQFDRRGGAFSGRLVADNEIYEKTGNIETLATVSIDYLVSRESFRAPDIIKIDVEGNEGLVIAGMKNTLARHRPIIICELHTHLGDSVEGILTSLAECGYTILNAHTGVPVTFSAGARQPFPNTHIVAIRR